MAITITRGSDHGGDRYAYDWGFCDKFAQVDTTQDASYFGTWACPERRRIFSYCEGDTTLTVCDTAEEFASEMARLKAWNVENGYWLGVDPGLSPDRIALWRTPELEQFLHPCDLAVAA
jgi:hypothetical protein